MTYPIAIEVDSAWSMRLAAAAARLWPLIGAHRAFRLGMWLARRLARWRINGGAWRRGMHGFGACSLLRPGHPPTEQPYPPGGRLP